MKKLLLAAISLAALVVASKADITDGKFSTNQIFDVQYYWSGNTLNASNFIAPYDMNFQHPTVGTGQYFQFFNSTTNPGTYGLGLYNADGTLAQVVHNTGNLQAIGPNALFYVGSGFFGTVITTGAGYSYGQSATFTNMDTTVTSSEASSYTWASTTPLGAGQTAPPPAPAFPVVNGDFATGALAPWVAGGGTGTQLSTAYSDNGVGVAIVQEMTSYQANGSSYSWTVKPPTGTYMASIQPNSTVNTGNTFNDMVAALGLSQTSKNEIIAAMVATGNGQPTNAAWIHQDITLSNGQSFKMAWQYISTDYVPYNDGSLTSLVNKTGTVVAKVNGENKEYALLGFTNPGTGNYSVGSYGATGWQLAEYTANEAGTYRLGFAAFNLSDTALSPILFVTQNVGTTLNFTTPFGAIAPNPGSSAPNTGGGTTPPAPPTVVSTAPGTPIVTTSSASGTPVTTSITNTNMVNGVDVNGNPTVTTYFTVTSTTVTPTETTTTTTPVTVTTYSDGTTTTTNGTPTTSSVTTYSTTTSTTNPAVQSVATTTTTSGPATNVSSTVYWTPIPVTTVTDTMERKGALAVVNRNTTTVTAHPSTVTVVTTTPITTTTTTVDGQGTKIGETASTINQNVSNTYDETLYTLESQNKKASANVMAMQDAIKISRTNPFLVDPLMPRDDTWITPRVKYYSVNGGYTDGGISFGKQKTVENNTFGVAFDVSEAKGSGYLNSQSNYNNYAATAYLLSRQPYAWFKVALGASTGDRSAVTQIPEFAMINSAKAKQNMFYGDVAVYAPNAWYGIRPFAGMTVVNSQIAGFTANGTPLIGQAMPNNNNSTQVMPYAGVRIEPHKNIGLELRATQTQDFGTVGGVRATVNHNLTNQLNVYATVGGDVGSKDYKSAVGMVGLNWKF